MGEAYLKKLGGSRFEVESAGTEPGSLNPRVVKALQEDGIDIRNKPTQSVFSSPRRFWIVRAPLCAGLRPSPARTRSLSPWNLRLWQA